MCMRLLYTNSRHRVTWDGPAGLEAIYYDEPIGWPAWHLAEAEPTLPGLILDDKIVLQTHVWVSKVQNFMQCLLHQ